MKRSEMMERAKFYRHGSKMVYHFDFSGLNAEEAHDVAHYGKSVIAKMPQRSLLTLTDVTNVNYDEKFSAISKDLVQHNKPFVLAGAVVGVTGWRKLAFWAALKFTGRNNLRLFDSTEEASEWLKTFEEAC